MVPACVSLCRIKKYMTRGFRLTSICIDTSYVGPKFGTYFLVHVSDLLGTKASALSAQTGYYLSTMANQLYYLLKDSDWIKRCYLDNGVFYDIQEFHYLTGYPQQGLQSWYDKTYNNFFNLLMIC